MGNAGDNLGGCIEHPVDDLLEERQETTLEIILPNKQSGSTPVVDP